MRIFDETKQHEIQEPDLDNGYLRADILVTAHHEAIPRKILKTAEEIAKELESQGEKTIHDEEGYFLIIETFEKTGGRTLRQIEDEVQEGKEAWDETEEIRVYIPFTPEQKKDYLRDKREPLLLAFDKWEKAVLRGREIEDETVMQWYRDLLDLKESAFKTENIPERVQYFL